MVAQVSYHFSSVQLAMRGLLSWFVVQLMPGFSLIDSELTCWGLLDVHSPEGGPSNPPQTWQSGQSLPGIFQHTYLAGPLILPDLM